MQLKTDLIPELKRSSFHRSYSLDGSFYLKEFVILGDSQVGKTALVRALQDENFKDEHRGTIYDRADFVVNVDGDDFNIRLHDTSTHIQLSFARQSICSHVRVRRKSS